MSVQEVLGLNLGWGSRYPEYGFSWFSSVPTGKFWNSTSTYGLFLPNLYQFISHKPSYRLTHRSRDIERAVK
jgi:hypothetical protein